MEPILSFLDFPLLIPTAARAIPSNNRQNAYKGVMRGPSKGGARRADPFVVEIVNVEVVDELAVTNGGGRGESEQVACGGSFCPSQPRFTRPVKSLR
jgi:hypothetical protein